MALAEIFGMDLAHGPKGRSPLLFWCLAEGGIALGWHTKSWVTKPRP